MKTSINLESRVMTLTFGFKKKKTYMFKLDADYSKIEEVIHATSPIDLIAANERFGPYIKECRDLVHDCNGGPEFF